MTTWTPTAPNEDLKQQQDVESANQTYYSDSDKMDDDNALRYQYIALMMSLAAAGNYDAAFMVAETEVLPQVTVYSTDQQNLYADTQRVAASVDAFNSRITELVNDGASTKDGTKGITPAQGKEIYDLQSDLWFDLNAPSYQKADGTMVNHSPLAMLDDNTKQNLVDSTSDIMDQFFPGDPVFQDPNSPFPYGKDKNGNDVAVGFGNDIQGQVNSWWAEQGTDGKVQSAQLTAVTDDLGNESSTCDSTEQSSNSLLENQIQITNTYLAGNQQVEQYTQGLVSAYVKAEKAS